MESTEIAHALERHRSRPKAQSGARVIALVGPTGVGKTTTVAKMASDALAQAQSQSRPDQSGQLQSRGFRSAWDLRQDSQCSVPLGGHRPKSCGSRSRISSRWISSSSIRRAARSAIRLRSGNAGHCSSPCPISAPISCSRSPRATTSFTIMANRFSDLPPARHRLFQAG